MVIHLAYYAETLGLALAETIRDILEEEGTKNLEHSATLVEPATKKITISTLKLKKAKGQYEVYLRIMILDNESKTF